MVGTPLWILGLHGKFLTGGKRCTLAILAFPVPVIFPIDRKDQVYRWRRIYPTFCGIEARALQEGQEVSTSVL